MAPVVQNGFSVKIHLLEHNHASQALSLTQKDTVIVSKDILEEFHEADRDGTTYIALTVLSSNRWNLYPVRKQPSKSIQHSSIWLPAHIYNTYYDQIVFARSTKPLPLSTLVLAFPASTFHLVSKDHIDLQFLLSQGHVFRTGDRIEINGFHGKIEMCEPVRQGILDSRSEIIIAKEQMDTAHDLQDKMAEEADALDDIESLSYGVSSLLSTSFPAQSSIDHLSFSISSLCTPIEARTLGVAPLARPVVNHQQYATETSAELCIYGSLELLLELGLFSGDDVEVSRLRWDEAEFPRAMKIKSLPAGHNAADCSSLFLNPILFHNIIEGHPPKVYIRKTKRRKSVPIAKCVTLGRVPSPASTDRALQNAFLSALKTYFEEAKRIVRSGDLLLLGIDETLARVTASEDLENEALLEYTQSSGRRKDTFAWFKVLEVQVDGKEDLWTSDAVVDAVNTRMIQAGVEKSRIPPFEQWAGYFNLPIPNKSVSSTASPQTRLIHLISATFGKMARKTMTCASVLIHGARGSGKTTIVSSTAGTLGMHFLEVNCFDIVGETEVKTEAYLRLRFEKAAQCSPCVLLLRNIDALAKKKDDMESGQESKMRFILADCLKNVQQDSGDVFPVAIVATTSDLDKIPDGVLGCFRHTIEIGAPDESERLGILQTLVARLPLAPDVSVQSLAVRSAALVAADLVNVVKRAQNFAQDRLDILASTLDSNSPSDIFVAGSWITAEDFDAAINEARRDYSDSIGAPKIPSVTWDDVGGLASVKDDIMDTIQLPLERPDLFASGMKKRSGILFYGPPGTGKTLLAKAVATSFSLNFFSVKGPELLNMYIGESEANVRRVFQRARDAKPCVVFFDELDSVAPKRGNQGDSGGVMDRIVSQLLSELDGMSEGKDGSGGVFVIGATNRPDLLDPALLRPGRFDKMLYLGVSDTDDAQLNILQALTRKFQLSPDLNLRDIARACPFTYTGADFYALCSDAMLKAMTRQAAAVDAKVKKLDPPRSTQHFFDHLATPEDTEVVVSERDFRVALSELIPSVSQSELDHYKKVQAQFSPVPPPKTAPAVQQNGIIEAVDSGTSNGHAEFGADNNDDDNDDDGGMYDDET